MKLLKEFKEFAVKGNVMDMAIGMVIGSAFTAIVKSLVDNIFLPAISIVTGGINYDAWNIVVGEGEAAPVIGLGTLTSAIVTFLIVSMCMFFLVKMLNALKRKKDEPAPAPKRVCPFCKMEISDDAVRCPHCTSQLD